MTTLPETGASPSTSATVVLVHGAWHGAWSWAALQAALDHRGVPSLAIDLPGHGASVEAATDLAGDAAHVRSVLDTIDGPVVLVGHSYGGAVVSAVPDTGASLRRTVFVAAFALRSGEAVNDIARAHPGSELRDAIVMRDDGTSVLAPGPAVPALYGECDDAFVSAALARVGAQRMANFVEPVTDSTLGLVPSTYVRCTLDRAVPLAQQDAMAVHCDEVVDIETDHSPFASAVDELADLLVRLADDAPHTARGDTP